MNNALKTRNEINKITGQLIGLSIADDQNFAVIKQIGQGKQDVTYNIATHSAVSLRNIPYQDIYDAIKQSRSYNIAFPDGALVQLHYQFKDGNLSSHRLAFFPCPDLSEFQNDPEIYETEMMYAEVTERRIVTTPIRFDYDPLNFVELKHPSTHLTIGQYSNCRIPVSCPVSPFRFFEFILSSFYNTAYFEYSPYISGDDITYNGSITPLEQKRIHVALPASET